MHSYTCRHGVNKWRDSASPVEILYEYARKDGWHDIVWGVADDTGLNKVTLQKRLGKW